MPTLAKPDSRYKQSLLDAARAHKASGERDGFFDAHDIEWFENNFDALLERYRNEEISENLEDGRVASSQFWVVDGDVWLGRFSLRHELNDRLRQYGGHLGYYLIPSARKKGIGTWAMGEVLKEAKKLGLDRLLVTCDEENIPSQKLIEKFGGVHEDTIPSLETGRPLMRWWVDLSTL